MYSTRIVYDLNLGDLLRLKLNVITDTWCGCYACECVCVLMLMLQIKCAAAETGIEENTAHPFQPIRLLSRIWINTDLKTTTKKQKHSVLHKSKHSIKCIIKSGPFCI